MTPESRTPEEIRRNIEATRHELASSVEVLGSRVRQLTDWRRQLREHRSAALAAAFVTGFVVGGGVAALGGFLRRR